MLAINLAKLALIELEYSAADCSRRKATTSDSLERGALNIQLPKIMAAKAAVEFAVELIRISSDSPENAHGAPTEPGTGWSTLSPPSLSLLSRFSLASPASAERESNSPDEEASGERAGCNPHRPSRKLRSRWASSALTMAASKRT
jgi:hypothetical protein